MIYLDTSVALAQLLAEVRRPPVSIWRETLVASRLLEYELWTRVNARGLARSHDELVRGLLGRLDFSSGRSPCWPILQAGAHARCTALGVDRRPAKARAGSEAGES